LAGGLAEELRQSAAEDEAEALEHTTTSGFCSKLLLKLLLEAGLASAFGMSAG
jgi:hypothetical protein